MAIGNVLDEAPKQACPVALLIGCEPLPDDAALVPRNLWRHPLPLPVHETGCFRCDGLRMVRASQDMLFAVADSGEDFAGFELDFLLATRDALVTYVYGSDFCEPT